jgi:hypothetical protein
MKDVEIEFVFGIENSKYPVLHRVAKSNGLTVEQFLIKSFAEMVESWDM